MGYERYEGIRNGIVYANMPEFIRDGRGFIDPLCPVTY